VTQKALRSLVLVASLPWGLFGCYPVVISGFPSARSVPQGSVSADLGVSGSRFVTNGPAWLSAPPDGYPTATQGTWTYEGLVLSGDGRFGLFAPGLTFGAQLSLGLTAQLDAEYQILGKDSPRSLALAIDIAEQAGFDSNTVTGGLIIQKFAGPVDWAVGLRYGYYTTSLDSPTGPPLWSIDWSDGPGAGVQYMGEPSGSFYDLMLGAYYPMGDHFELRLQAVERTLVDPVHTYATIDGYDGADPNGYAFNFEPIWSAFLTFAWLSAQRADGPGQMLVVRCDERCLLWVDGTHRFKLRAHHDNHVTWLRAGPHHLVLTRKAGSRQGLLDASVSEGDAAIPAKIEKDVTAERDGTLRVEISFDRSQAPDAGEPRP